MRKRGRSYYRFYGVLSIALFIHLFISNQNRRVHRDFKHIFQSETESHAVMSDSFQPHGLYHLWNSPGQNIGVGNLFLLQQIFPTQGSNPVLPHCRQIFYQLSHKGSPRILEWVVYPFSRGSSQPRYQTQVSCIARTFFTN